MVLAVYDCEITHEVVHPRTRAMRGRRQLAGMIRWPAQQGIPARRHLLPSLQRLSFERH